MTTEEFKTVTDWLEAHLPGGAKSPCKECNKSPGMGIGELVRHDHYTGGGITQLGGPAAVDVPVTCMGCGHTRFFSAKVIGMLK